MPEAIRMVFAVCLALVGLSHLVRGDAWARLFALLTRQGEAGALVNAMMTLWPGLLVVLLHPVYEWPYMWFTLLGWAWVVKGGVYLVMPAFGLRQMARHIDHPAAWKGAGVGLLILAALLVW